MANCIKQGFFIALSLLAVVPLQSSLAQTNAPPAPAAQAAADVDNRSAIMTRPNERHHILTNMRKYLVGLQAMTEALGRDDMPAATAAARTMGTINLYSVKLMFPNKAAIEFRNFASEVQRDFDAVAKDADSKKDPKLMLSQVGAIMKKCTHCHETYKLQDTVHSK